MPFPSHFRLPPEAASLRLDAALALFLPEASLRARRRLWLTHDVLVNGKARPPGFAVRGGDSIGIQENTRGISRCDAEKAYQPPAPEIRLLALNDDFAALCKPHGLHSAHVPGSCDPSVEIALRERWPDLARAYAQRQETAEEAPAAFGNAPVLLNRLDKPTSGIVLAALHAQAAARFRRWEAEGEVEKIYFALLAGEVPQPLLLRQKLDTAKRKTTRVLPQDNPDPVRHTRIAPLALLHSGTPLWDKLPPPVREQLPHAVFTMALVRIRRGARHQIRAHAAAAGYPVVGDDRYGPSESAVPGLRLYLHHARIFFPGFEQTYMPDWGLGEALP